jgi:hypothetical protein
MTGLLELAAAGWADVPAEVARAAVVPGPRRSPEAQETSQVHEEPGEPVP